MKTILVLGGYGNFGKRIVESLCDLNNIKIIIAGRNLSKANALVEELSLRSNAILQSLDIDIFQPIFTDTIHALSPFLVIHTGGPFQGQGYTVPQACIAAGVHYIDLADDRRFVSDISNLDDIAQRQGILIVSGASSVPGLSSAVIDHYQAQYSAIHSIDIAIAPGNKAERGEATIRGILSYIGRPINVFRESQWKHAFGWMNAKRVNFGKMLGKRWLANVDVPDLELFPSRYSVKERVTFQAGLELSVLHLTMIAMAFFAKVRLVKDWSKLTSVIASISRLFNYFGTDKGGMRIVIEGVNKSGQTVSTTWNLFAANGVGPYIPTFSAVIIARKLIDEEIFVTGARPCLDLFTIEDFYPYFNRLGITYKEEVHG